MLTDEMVDCESKPTRSFSHNNRSLIRLSLLPPGFRYCGIVFAIVAKLGDCGPGVHPDPRMDSRVVDLVAIPCGVSVRFLWTSCTVKEGVTFASF